MKWCCWFHEKSGIHFLSWSEEMWKLSHCAVVEKSIVHSSGKEEEENGNWDKVWFGTDLWRISVWVAGEADGQRGKWGWAALKCQMYLERSWVRMALFGILTALLEGILWRGKKWEWKCLSIMRCCLQLCFSILLIFLSALLYGSGIYMNIFSRVDQKLELRMQLGYLVKLNF